MIDATKNPRFLCLITMICSCFGGIGAQSKEESKVVPDKAVQDSVRLSLEQLKVQGALRSSYRTHDSKPVAEGIPKPDLLTFQRDIEPILAKACYECHGPKKQKGELRIDTLDADLFGGRDVDWWLEVLAVLTNGEMPPEDDAELADPDRAKVIEWLASEVQIASSTRRATTTHSSFRRMARYEYNYALQDLLGLPFDFAEDLPPDPTSVDGFQNSSDVLHLSGVQFRAYLESSRKALQLATAVGTRPEPMYWGVSMEAASIVEWRKQDKQLENIRKKHAADPEKLQSELARQEKRHRVRPNRAYYEDRSTGRIAHQSWGYNGASFAWKPVATRPEPPTDPAYLGVIPKGRGMIVELGNHLPERGMLRIRVRASRAARNDAIAPSMQLHFGWQASNDSSAVMKISERDIVVAAGDPRFYQWDIPLSQIYPRNLVRTTSKLGAIPSPSEYLKIVNGSVTGADIEIDYVEVTAPFFEQWPPASHKEVFIARRAGASDAEYARDVIATFLPRAWRRDATQEEIDRKLALFDRLRPKCDSLEEAMIEVLATVLASPNFLYIVESGQVAEEPTNQSELDAQQLSDLELASRLSMFLWCSTPDAELLSLAKQGRLQDAEVLAQQIERLLYDRKSQRMSRHFVRQWLGLELLDFLHVDRKAYPHFDEALREAMAQEPVVFFHELLRNNHSVLEFLHSDFTMANERLAQHYGLRDVTGNHFRRVELLPEQRRGGVLTQAGLLAMNSDGLDSHPLKRGIWMLERLLNDPPPPPPPAVPEIDLADPEIAKLTLKQRIENHRDSPACMSCHAKIDPWGIAFEEYDAVGLWRTEVQGKPVDSVSYLFNRQKLDGVDGLKRFLLENRQDQFVRAMVHKLTTFALGRPLAFTDRAAIDEITAAARQQGDGLASMVRVIATSLLFHSK